MNYLIQINDHLQHAPVGVLAMLFSIAMGYVLKSLPFINNKIIPAIVVPVTSFAYTSIQFSLWTIKDDAHPISYIPLNLMLGFIYGAMAWFCHAQILRRWIDPKLFNDDGSTKFFTKPNPSDPGK